jgi:hypothetical protein
MPSILSPRSAAGDPIHNWDNRVAGIALARYIRSALDRDLFSARAFFNDLSGSLDFR